MISRFVLNASLALSWCFNEESAPATERILRSFIDGSTACVPYLWMWEINNTLCLAERSNRLTKSERLEKINLLLNLRIDFDETAHQQCAGSTTDIALEHRLSVMTRLIWKWPFASNCHSAHSTRNSELQLAAQAFYFCPRLSEEILKFVSIMASPEHLRQHALSR